MAQTLSQHFCRCKEAALRPGCGSACVVVCVSACSFNRKVSDKCSPNYGGSPPPVCTNKRSVYAHSAHMWKVE